MARALTYKDAGVDIETKGAFTDTIPAIMRRTYGPRVIDLPDGFAGLFALDKMGLLAKRYREPVLAACTDGVGTKLKIAFLMDKHDTVGIDLVAMSVNDLITVGAEPLYFLDYIATSKIEPAKLAEILKGIAEGCVQSNCALLGGETAEMAGFYAPGEYDLAGFATGVVERGRIINGGLIRPKDVVIGVASSGLHSNGYTLVRKAFFDEGKMSVGDPVAEFGCPLGEELLRPTKIYAATVARLLAHYKVKHVLHGIANITGGGLRDNIERLLPKRCQARIVKKLLAGPAGLPGAQPRRPRRRGRDVPRLQHGRRPGADRPRVQRRRHPQPPQAPGRNCLAHRRSPPRQEGRRVRGVTLVRSHERLRLRTNDLRRSGFRCHSRESGNPAMPSRFPGHARHFSVNGPMNKKPAVYILASKRNGTLYIGVTNDLARRGWEHKNDLADGFTRRYGVHCWFTPSRMRT